jgi:hypothetical protein
MSTYTVRLPYGLPAKRIKTARRYRTIQIQAGRQTITTADPLPDDLRARPSKPSPALAGDDTNLSQLGSISES